MNEQQDNYKIESTTDGFHQLELALYEAKEKLGWKDITAFLTNWFNKNQPKDNPYDLNYWLKTVEKVLKDPDVLKRADCYAMKQAGWVREEEWIFVEDENTLPKTEGFYNVFSEYYEEVATLFYSLKYERFGDLDAENEFSPCEFGDMVTHWKPLPQPPKQ